MRLEDGGYDCDICGAVVDVPPGSLPYPTIVARSREPNVRVLWVGVKEVHRCEMPDTAVEPHGNGMPERQPSD